LITTPPRRGDLFFAELEVIGRKLVLIVSWDEINERMRQPIVCLVSAKWRSRSLATYVELDPPEGGVNRSSFILCHALLTIPEWRLETEPLGSLGSATMYRVEQALACALDLPEEVAPTNPA
jgi:mRNA-degrading endonuclease toxin of MazEF toxin-antitoxin module